MRAFIVFSLCVFTWAFKSVLERKTLYHTEWVLFNDLMWTKIKSEKLTKTIREIMDPTILVWFQLCALTLVSGNVELEFHHDIQRDFARTSCAHIEWANHVHRLTMRSCLAYFRIYVFFCKKLSSTRRSSMLQEVLITSKNHNSTFMSYSLHSKL